MKFNILLIISIPISVYLFVVNLFFWVLRRKTPHLIIYAKFGEPPFTNWRGREMTKNERRMFNIKTVDTKGET